LTITKLNGNKEIWESYPRFKNAINGNLIKIISIKEILNELFPMIRTTVASTEIGRLLQVLKASGWLH
jgi:hypothetical protein